MSLTQQNTGLPLSLTQQNTGLRVSLTQQNTGLRVSLIQQNTGLPLSLTQQNTGLPLSLTQQNTCNCLVRFKTLSSNILAKVDNRVLLEDKGDAPSCLWRELGFHDASLNAPSVVGRAVSHLQACHCHTACNMAHVGLHHQMIVRFRK